MIDLTLPPVGRRLVAARLKVDPAELDVALALALAARAATLEESKDKPAVPPGQAKEPPGQSKGNKPGRQ